MAQVPTLKPHLRRELPPPAPRKWATCTKHHIAPHYHPIAHHKEIANGLIRQYIPKGTAFIEPTDEMLAEIE